MTTKTVRRKNTFSKSWLDVKDFQDWLKSVPGNNHKAHCKACKSEIDISVMGKSALNSRMKSGKHSDNVKLMNACMSMTDFVVKAKGSNQDEINSSNKNGAESPSTVPSSSNEKKPLSLSPRLAGPNV